MSVVGDLRAGLKANLDPVGRSVGINVSRYALSSPTGPVIHLWPAGIVYHRAMQMGLQQVTFTVQAAVPVTTDQDPQAKLDRLLDGTGTDSLRAAVESDKTLGGACERLQVESVSEIQYGVTLTNEPRLTADWVVTVYV